MDITRWIILVALFGLVFGLYQASDASAATINLDLATLQKGYTVESSDGNFSLAVLPRTAKSNVEVEIKKLAQSDFPLPEELSYLSDVYEYDLRATPKADKSNVIISLSFASCSDNNQALYFYDKNWRQWRLLNSQVVNQRLQAKVDFPYLIVAILGKSENAWLSESDLTAQAAIVVDRVNNEIVFNKNIDEIRPLASMTKLMTALVFLDNNPGWEKVVKMQEQDFVGGASLLVKAGDKLTVKDLFGSMLVASKNNAVMALVRASGLTTAEFVNSMNEKAKGMGLTNTFFADPTGLSEKNVSSAREFARIAKEAFSRADIWQATTKTFYKVKIINTNKFLTLQNTSDKVLKTDLQITGTKTGFTNEAGYCLASSAKRQDKEFLAIVMGSKINRNYDEVYALLKEQLVAGN